MEQTSLQFEARLRAIQFVNPYGIENRRRGWDSENVVKEHSELLARMRTDAPTPERGSVRRFMEK